MKQLLKQALKHQLARYSLAEVPLPFNYTLGLTYKCQARCKTCRIYERQPVDELTTDEWSKVFNSIGESPYWITFTGGEPFLRKDITRLYEYLVTYCQPAIVNIPTNGQLAGTIAESVHEMLTTSSTTQLIINLSLDHHIPEKNDEIRGLKGYMNKALDTLIELNMLKNHFDNLEVGIHTVISEFNVTEFPEIRERLLELPIDPANYITEIAEQRVELGTKKLPITPLSWQYKEAIKPLVANGYRNTKQAFRKQYYKNVSSWLYNGNTMPRCFAGRTSCQITPDGQVWNCCIQAKVMGNLRDWNYNFKALWNSYQAQFIRGLSEKCTCPMANVNYTNMLMSPKQMIKVGRNLL